MEKSKSWIDRGIDVLATKGVKRNSDLQALQVRCGPEHKLKN